MTCSKKSRAKAKSNPRMKPLSKSFKSTMAAWNRTDKVQQERLKKLQKEADKKGYKLVY